MKITDPNFNQELKKIVAIYERLYPKNRYEIEDIAQTVVCNALRLGVTEFLPAFLKTSIKNEIVNIARSARVKVNVSLDAPNPNDPFSEPTHERRQSARTLRRVLDAESSKAQVLDVRSALEESHVEGENVMSLYFIDGLDLSEIAERTGTNRGSAHRKLHRQMKRAKQLLSDYQDNFPKGSEIRLSRETERDIKGRTCTL